MRRLLFCALTLGVASSAACSQDRRPPVSPHDGGTDATTPDSGAPDAGFMCDPGARDCFGYVHYVCGDDGHSREEEQVCEGGCDPALGCVECTPGSFRCDGTISMRCDESHRWMPVRDCAEWETTCGASGLCADACALAEAVRSNVGCEYWPVPMANIRELDAARFDFRVVVTNPNPSVAEVTITRGSRLILHERVPPGGLAEIPLPWVDGVSFPIERNEWQSVTTADGAYRLRSSQPVIVSQFNPFHYKRLFALSFSNDASLLLPSHALGSEHIATSYAPMSTMGTNTDGDRVYYSLPGYIALVGVSSEATQVEIVASGHVAADADGRWPATPPGGTIRFSLARGEVAQVMAAVPPRCTPERPVYSPHPEFPELAGACREDEYDLTGSRIVSDRPISVFGAHVCAFVPFDVGMCDHLETTVAPIGTWGRAFLTAPMREPGTDAPNILRIIASANDTAVTLTPPPEGWVDRTLSASEWVEVAITEPVAIQASAPIQAAQMLVGQLVTDPPLERGDPSLTVLVPEEQFRRSYVFITPSSYTAVADGQSYLLISREPDEPITLDGEAITAEWTRVGERELAIVPVAGGTHRVEAATPVGVIAYGLGLYTSYAYPAGLDLRVLPI